MGNLSIAIGISLTAQISISCCTSLWHLKTPSYDSSNYTYFLYSCLALMSWCLQCKKTFWLFLPDFNNIQHTFIRLKNSSKLESQFHKTFLKTIRRSLQTLRPSLGMVNSLTEDFLQSVCLSVWAAFWDQDVRVKMSFDNTKLMKINFRQNLRGLFIGWR